MKREGARHEPGKHAALATPRWEWSTAPSQRARNRPIAGCENLTSVANKHARKDADLDGADAGSAQDVISQS